MPASPPILRYPSARVLLPRTRLAYIHLRNLLNDAKRDRSARVSGYVAIWLPEEMVMLYLQRGEVVNATRRDVRTGESRAVAIASAIEAVPLEPEYGEICFHEGDDELLGAMYASQSVPPAPWPEGLAVTNPSSLFPYLMSTTYDGFLEIVADDAVNYLVFKDGSVARAFLASAHHGTVIDRVAKLFSRDGRLAELRVSRWDGHPSLPTQAPPALLHAYRELTTALVKRLVDSGRASAPEIAEHARVNLATTHPSLDGLGGAGRGQRDPVTSTEALTRAVALWMAEVVWAAADHDTTSPETLLRELTWERRHMFQSAGLYEQLPWKVL